MEVNIVNGKINKEWTYQKKKTTTVNSGNGLQIYYRPSTNAHKHTHSEWENSKDRK